ncbi:hypothetical protein [Micromonospora chalcea]|uniref:hypothetical protein n=1 Tax=Micromonospora chalcea TaxID=1874 RepID=UPI003D71EEB9
MSTDESNLTRVTLDMPPRAVASLELLREDGSTRAEAINRAVQLHAALLPYLDALGRLPVLTPGGERVLIVPVG